MKLSTNFCIWIRTCVCSETRRKILQNDGPFYNFVIIILKKICDVETEKLYVCMGMS